MPNPSGVIVLGMHRSGTSAVTRALNLLGLPLGDPDKLLPASAENPKGFWENADLTRLNDDLLAALGGSWAGPPILGEGWMWDARLQPLRERAYGVFDSVYGNGPWAWKDPRNCLLLPFWLSVLNVRPAVILVHRNPVEIAHSLQTRNGFSKLLSLALWERYMREALRAAGGLPVLVTTYPDLLDDAEGWCGRVRPFLQRHGIACGEEDQRGELTNFLDRGLRHSAVGDEEIQHDADVSDSQRRLLVGLSGLRGVHDRFHPPDLGGESRWTEALLAERRRTDVTERRRALEFQAFERERQQRNDPRLEQALRAAQEHAAQAEERAARADDRAREQADEVLRIVAERDNVARRLELVDTENESLSNEILRLGKALAAQRELETVRAEELRRLAGETVPRLGAEVAARESLVNAMRRTKVWRLRSAARRLFRLGE